MRRYRQRENNPIEITPRFYEPTRGLLLINETPVQELNLKDLRTHTGIVLQSERVLGGPYGKISALEKRRNRRGNPSGFKNGAGT